MQYVTTIRHHSVYPIQLRVNYGAEALLMGAIYLGLFAEAVAAEGVTKAAIEEGLVVEAFL